MMVCEKCGSILKVEYTETLENENLIIRKRKCSNPDCRRRYYTDEAIVYDEETRKRYSKILNDRKR